MDILDCVVGDTETVINCIEDQKIHPWRLCPMGKHFVKRHIEHIPPSQQYPNGHRIEVRDHCADNPSKKDILTFDEIQVMTEKYFHQLSGPPNEGVPRGYQHKDDYNIHIRGWVRYWNDIFQLDDPLDPNIVKALIASESSFYTNNDHTDGHGQGRVRGLMQVTDATLHILSDHHCELHDYLVCVEHEQLIDPSANICAGTRWLFRKKVTASAKLKREATWLEAVADYKSILNKISSSDLMDRFNHLYLSIIEG